MSQIGAERPSFDPNDRSSDPGMDPPAGQAARPSVSPATALVAALLGFFMIMLDASVVNLALPMIGRHLRSPMSGLQWVVDAYTLMFGALMLSAGTLSDRVGARRVYAVGLTAFTLASAACGLSPGLGVLVVARGLQGAAAALMLPSSVALVRQSFSDVIARTKAVGIWSAGGALAVPAGPIIGGALTDLWSWRAIFALNVPIGLGGLLLLARSARSATRRRPLDLPGQVCAVTALMSLTFAVIEGGHGGFARPTIVGAVLVAVLAGTAFLVVEARSPHPMVPLDLFRHQVVSTAIAGGVTLNIAYYGIVFVLSLYFQQVYGRSALVAGLMFVPMAAVVPVFNLASTKLTTRFGARLPIVAGQVIMIVGLVVLLPADHVSSSTMLALMVVPLGLGGGLAITPLTTTLLEAIEHERAGLAAGLFNSTRQIGGGLAVAVFGSLVADVGHFWTGMRECLVASVVLLVACLVASLTSLPRGPAAWEPR